MQRKRKGRLAMNGPPKFHPQVRAMMEREKGSSIGSITNYAPAEYRRIVKATPNRTKRAPEEVGKFEETSFPGPSGDLPLRVYWPKGAKGKEKLPVLVYYHGGGFVAGSAEEMDPTCRRLANRARHLVVSVGYRLAPEDKFPAAPEDCFAALVWTQKNASSLGGDPSRIAVAGSSAGGNLAAVVAILAREREGPKISRQVLVYPVTDLTRSLRKFSKSGFGPTDLEMKYCYRHYLTAPDDAKDPRASPLLGDLHGLPPAIVVTAEYDTLTEQVDDYAAKLREGGVKVRSRQFPGMMHGFFMEPDDLDTAEEAIDWVASELTKPKVPASRPRRTGL
ncbi:MAG: alpha/beta hydrolase [Thaumarchaeota archaeon]|nr:alpha/beta hydrolase [Nitrososphaerota archaeon]